MTRRRRRSAKTTQDALDQRFVKDGIKLLVRLEARKRVAQADGLRRCFAVAARILTCHEIRFGLMLLTRPTPWNWQPVSQKSANRRMKRSKTFDTRKLIQTLLDLNIIEKRTVPLPDKNFLPTQYRFKAEQTWDWSEMVRRGGTCPATFQPHLEYDAWRALKNRERVKPLAPNKWPEHWKRKEPEPK